MRGRRLGVVLVAVLPVAFVGACALDEAGTAGDGGGPDVTLDVVGVDATPDGDAGTNEAAADVVDDGDSQTADVVPDVVPDVIPTCGSGTTCLPTLSGNFRYVEYEGANLSACTQGFGGQKDLRENPQPVNNSCSCSCATKPATDPTCTCGGTTAAFDILSGSNCPPGSPSEVLASTSCYTTTQSLSGNNDAIVAQPDAGCAPSGGACGNASPASNFTSTSTPVRRCDVTGTPPACNGGSCVPNPAGSYARCVTDGTLLASCPGGFPNAHVVGTGVTDTRTCSCTGSCGLNAGTCGTPTLTLYTSGNCGAGAQPAIPADGTTCKTGFGVNPSWGSAKYTSASTGASCSYSGGTSIGGGVALTGAYTICCP
jgi:hypothetical protein